MNIEERKKVFRFLLKSIFFDDCQEIDDDLIIKFYDFLLDSLEIRSDHYVNADNNGYFVIESVIQVLGQFHRMDSHILLHITKNPNHFREMVSEQTALPIEYVSSMMEVLMGEFQEIKSGFLFYS